MVIGIDDVYVQRAERAVVIATGTRAAVPPIPGLRDIRIWDNRRATASEDVPVRLLVLGGGHGNGFPAAELDPIVHEFFDRNLRNKSDAAWPATSELSVKALSADAPSPYAPTRGG